MEAKTHADITGPWKELPETMERSRHDSIGGIEGFLDTVSVVHIDIDIQHSRMYTI
jgi:hypothetical protein